MANPMTTSSSRTSQLTTAELALRCLTVTFTGAEGLSEGWRHLSLSTPCCQAQTHCLLSGNLGKVMRWGKEETIASDGWSMGLSSLVVEEPVL